MKNLLGFFHIDLINVTVYFLPKFERKIHYKFLFAFHTKLLTTREVSWNILYRQKVSNFCHLYQGRIDALLLNHSHCMIAIV